MQDIDNKELFSPKRKGTYFARTGKRAILFWKWLLGKNLNPEIKNIKEKERKVSAIEGKKNIYSPESKSD